jgi:hypothetical protein
MMIVIFPRGGEFALASTRFMLRRCLFGQTLFTKALVLFEGHVLFHGKFGRSSWALGRKMNVLR